MSKTAPATTSPCWSLIFWWAATIITLVLLDDLLFGPAFWALSQVGQVLATVTAFLASFVFQIWMTWAGLRPQPGRVAQFFVNRLMVAHKRRQITEREETLRNQITSIASAIVASLLFGGVIPVIFLHRRGMMSVGYLRRLSFVTSAVYAIEFALIHGGYGFGAVVRWLV